MAGRICASRSDSSFEKMSVANLEVTTPLRSLRLQLYLNAGIPLSWSFVAFMRAWSGYHFSLADRAWRYRRSGEWLGAAPLSSGPLQSGAHSRI